MRLLLVTAIMISLLTGCMFNSDKNSSKKQTTLKVLCFDKESFNERLGMLVRAKFIDFKLDVVDYSSIADESGFKKNEEALLKLFKETQPDIVFIPDTDYRLLVDEGYLCDLQPLITKDNFDLNEYIPGVISTLKSLGNGSLYGLSADYMSICLFYNEDLFKKHGVPVPSNQMTWDETFTLAKRFKELKSDDGRKILGLRTYVGDNVNFNFIAELIADTWGLRYTHPETSKLYLSTTDWKEVYSLTESAFRDGIFKVDSTPSETFIDDNVAMFLLFSNFITEFKEGVPFSWQVVTMPVDPKNPSTAALSFFGPVSAINKKSNQLPSAWEVVKYINSNEVANAVSEVKSLMFFSTRSKYTLKDETRDLSALTMLRPKENASNVFKYMPFEFKMMHFSEIVNTEAEKLLKRQASVDQVLAEIEVKAQTALDAYNEELALKEKKEAEKKRS